MLQGVLRGGALRAIRLVRSRGFIKGLAGLFTRFLCALRTFCMLARKGSYICSLNMVPYRPQRVPKYGSLGCIGYIRGIYRAPRDGFFSVLFGPAVKNALVCL